MGGGKNTCKSKEKDNRTGLLLETSGTQVKLTGNGGGTGRDQEKTREEDEDQGRITKGPLCQTEELGLCPLGPGEPFTGHLQKEGMISVSFGKNILMADHMI